MHRFRAPDPNRLEDIDAALTTIVRLKNAAHEGRRTSVHHQLMNHLGVAERSLWVVSK
jgi:hypothetical protein